MSRYPKERSMSEQPTHHGYAVNVKDHGLYNVERGPLTDEQVEAIYQAYVADFWDAAHWVAQDHGFDRVYSEGRMGGWAVPDPQPPHYAEDGELDGFMERFRPLERALLALMEDFRHDFLEALADAVERAEREPAERAYWEARDTITI
jgi:hypothetical protein